MMKCVIGIVSCSAQIRVKLNLWQYYISAIVLTLLYEHYCIIVDVTQNLITQLTVYNDYCRGKSIYPVIL